ncbi:MAG: hypothetical protein A2Y40_03385 [Candidatus Margulisbacteria bacterium GWF2_35_9]|nr:MAG: hypothetical protein A2Y40_03385 [Candidatus Margulisbacteria bacterium GWF2_35_9]
MTTTINPNPVVRAIQSLQTTKDTPNLPKVIQSLKLATGIDPFPEITLGKNGECAKINSASGCLELTNPNEVKEAEFLIKDLGLTYLHIEDYPIGTDDRYNECNSSGTCTVLSFNEALGADSKTVQNLFSNETYASSLEKGELNELAILRRLLAEEVSSKDSIGTRLDPNSLFLSGVLHSFTAVTSTFADNKKISFLVGNAPLKSYENLPTGVSGDNMIKVSVQEGTSFPTSLYLDLEKNQNGTLYKTYFTKTGASWQSINIDHPNYLTYLETMKTALNQVYQGDSSTDGKIQAYDAIKYINNVIENN